MGNRIGFFRSQGTLLATATVVTLLVLGGVAGAFIEQAEQIGGKGNAINCRGDTSATISSYCKANKEFEEFDSNTNRVVLEFRETKVLSSDLREGRVVSSRFYDVYQSAFYPLYLVYFSSHTYLDLSFERLTGYIEEKNEQLGNYIFKSTNEGHDLVISDIARFYNFMKSRGLPLNAAEAHLKRAFIDANILVQNNDGPYGEGVSGAVILAISQDSQKGTLSHELNHGAYFIDATYRQLVQACWMDLSSDDKSIVQNILGKITDGIVDVKSDPSLFLREFAAYFRDSETLIREYLEEDEEKSNISKLLSIEIKLRSIEKHIQFYRKHVP